MNDATRFKLHFGPYETPRFEYGQKLTCEVRGELTICGMSDARIAWPIGRIGSNKSLVVYAGLASAIRRESITAVAHHWGVTTQTVIKWRRRLGITGQQPAGTSRLRQSHFAEPWGEEARRKAWSKARDPSRREKIAAAKRGKPRPASVIEALRQANRGRPLSAEHRRKLSEIRKARGIRPPWLKPPWQPWEDELLRTLPKAEVAARTGRTLSAVTNRRHALGLTSAGASAPVPLRDHA